MNEMLHQKNHVKLLILDVKDKMKMNETVGR